MSRKNSVLYQKGKDGKDYYQKQPFESLLFGSMEKPEVRNEPKATIWLSLLKSPAYQSLSAKALILHAICLTQAFAKKKPKVKGYQLDELEFCLSYRWLHNQYPDFFPNDNKISGAKKELIEKGFIVEVSNGRKDGERSIYKMSDRWKTYRPEKKCFRGYQK